MEYELGKQLEVMNAKLDWLIQRLQLGDSQQEQEEEQKPIIPVIKPKGFKYPSK